MNLFNLIMLQDAAPGGGGQYTGIIMIVAMVAIFYFFMIRPQNKKQKEIKKAREALGAGDAIVTAGGIYGKIKEVKDTTFIIEVAAGINIKFEKTSVYPAPTQADAAKK